MRVLVVEDDEMIREGIVEYLSEFGYSVVEASDGEAAINQFDESTHLVILDIQIPFKNGLEVLKEIREKSNLPVLILTAFSDETYKIDAFTNLADGYIEKPFSLSLLKVRVDALIQKYYGTHDYFEYRGAEVDFKRYTARLNGKLVDMNPKELEILKFLIENEGYALTREQILNHVWKGTDDVPYDRVIDVYIKELRKKLQLNCITTIRNVGYRLERR
ncbi:response regulator transcription factor [Macrococcoides goetzii]|uniref:response regulator transcription factor n=1 Tax=Macrococcus sp. PK TaxID=2801919 RepID=UPI001F0E652D|nr:response regulator transcription factor [Macrococcus sp. PK]MCH4985933.1 response regulator transcription factor [Macrococcus sp. PK]